MSLPYDPGPEFSLCPFWFWNDELDQVAIADAMRDFREHGVHAFVIHPRLGLPRDCGWMSDRLLDFIAFAVEEAERHGMWVVLYDEGMYPSGSSSGQVVASDPSFGCRGLHRRPVGSPLGPDETVLGRYRECEVVEGPIRSTIRGLHYLGDGPEEDAPPAADLLNPDAVRCFIRLVYDRYAERLGSHFGRTIRGIFTDEPSLLGRPAEPNLRPGTRDVVQWASPEVRDRWIDLWNATSPAAARYEADLRRRLEETYYRPLASWCREHGIALMGHPEAPDDMNALRFFDVPGQDLVWRWVLPGPTAIEGPQSTQAKAAASAMVHAGKRRNSNEFAGAYGHELTFEEFKWLLDWCLVRGTNLFFPHAFYYSLRGPRRDERPPDVGPNCAWWGRFGDFARYAARLSWLNTDSEAVVPVAIVGNADASDCSWPLAKILFQNQVDFHYLPPQDLDAHRRRYLHLIDGASGENALREMLPRLPRTLDVESHPDLRLRRVIKHGVDWVFAHNEGGDGLDLAMPAPMRRIDPWSLDETVVSRLILAPFELTLLQSGPQL